MFCNIQFVLNLVRIYYAQVPGGGPAPDFNSSFLNAELNGFGVSSASWRKYLHNFPDSSFSGFVESRRFKLLGRLAEYREFWRNFTPSARQSSRVPFVLVEPKMVPEDDVVETGKVRYRYCNSDFIQCCR